jgi:curved DNA-binding protein
VRGLDGELDVKIPPGLGNGQKLRLRGRGLPRPKSTERGDLYVVAEIEVPKNVGAAERALWEQLAKSSSFQPRG